MIIGGGGLFPYFYDGWCAAGMLMTLPICIKAKPEKHPYHTILKKKTYPIHINCFKINCHGLYTILYVILFNRCYSFIIPV